MFEEMVSQLKNGIMPEPDLLHKRFDRALVKKLAVLKTPYPFWPADKKINPSSKELLWAAVLLEDRESFLLLEGIIATELAEKKKASGLHYDPGAGAQATDDFVAELLQLSPSDQFMEFLGKKVENIRS